MTNDEIRLYLVEVFQVDKITYKEYSKKGSENPDKFFRISFSLGDGLRLVVDNDYGFRRAYSYLSRIGNLSHGIRWTLYLDKCKHWEAVSLREKGKASKTMDEAILYIKHIMMARKVWNNILDNTKGCGDCDDK